jgi:hypothetical protein
VFVERHFPQAVSQQNEQFAGSRFEGFLEWVVIVRRRHLPDVLPCSTGGN